MRINIFLNVKISKEAKWNIKFNYFEEFFVENLTTISQICPAILFIVDEIPLQFCLKSLELHE